MRSKIKKLSKSIKVQNSLYPLSFGYPKRKWCFYCKEFHTDKKWYVLEQVRPIKEDNTLSIIPFSCKQLLFMPPEMLN